MEHKFVKYIPDYLENNILYVSIDYKTTVHRCCCGCGSEVVTPLSPTDWKLTYDGKTISLFPSIGNWSFKCKSHYWITNDRVIWAERWSTEQIKLSRKYDHDIKIYRYNKKNISTEGKSELSHSSHNMFLSKLFSHMRNLKNWFS